MTKQIAALSINKVQTFLFDVIHAHVQEKQVEQATLKNIMNASKEISNDFQRVIKSKFAGVEMQELLSCSGMYIFSCVLPESEIKKRLNELFLDYYKKSQGKKQLRYVCFEAGQQSEIEVINRAKEELKKSAVITEIIEKNKEFLFSFQPAQNNDEFMNDTGQYPMFAADINALFNHNETENKNHFRIAVIKADLDGMGKLFKEIKDYQEYRDISRRLNADISLNGLHQAAKKIALDNQKEWLFPFYIAGDDIFFAVSVANLIKGIDVCRQILQDINKAIEKMHPQRDLITMSIGVEITFNREPVRYYLSMVEKQLKCAKGSSEDSERANKVLSKFLQTKIAIGGTTYYDIDYAEVKQYKKRFKGARDKRKIEINRALGTVPVWAFFLNEVKVLNSVRLDDSIKDLIGTPGFYYTLLNALTEVYDNDVKYCNNLLYHLRPKYLKSPPKGEQGKDLRKKELLLNRGIIRQLYQKTSDGDQIIINEVTKYRLEVYLRLMILFSDDRFRVRIVDDNKGSDFREEDIKKELLRKPMQYLYDNLKCGHGSKLIHYFAKYPNYKEHDEKKGKYLQRLRIEKSMFFRLRETGKVNVEKAANMIEMQNSSNDKKSSDISLSPYRMEFQKEEFCRAAKDSGQWTTDFIDSLMLLYEYNDLIIQFYPKKRKGA